MVKPSSRFNPILLCLLILAGLNALAYAPSLYAPFVFDDFINIVENPAMREAGSGQASLLALAQPRLYSRRPLAYLSFALNLRLFGLDPLPFHALNLLIHICNSFLVFGLLLVALRSREWRGFSTRAPWLGVVSGALLWSLHPVQVQAVTYIVQRMTSMATLFYLLALFLAVQARRQFRSSLKITLGLGAAAITLLGFMTKEILVTLPLALLLAEFCLFDDPRPLRQRKSWLIPAVLALAAYAALLVLYGPEILREIGIYSKKFTLGTGDRLLTQARVIAHYLSLLAWPDPSRLNLDPQWTMSKGLFLPKVTFPALVFILGLVVLGFRWLKTRPLAALALLFFFLALLPEAGFFPLDPGFDHRLYLPSVAILALAGAAWTRPGPWRKARLSLFALSVIFLGALTFSRNLTWSDDVRLWQDTVKKSPGSVRAWTNLAKHLTDLGRYPEAIFAGRKAIALEPCATDALSNLGGAWLGLREFAAARQSFAQALKCDPNYETARAGLDLADQLEQDLHFPSPLPPPAEADDPTGAGWRFRRGFSRMRDRRYAEAVRNLKRATRLQPDFGEAYLFLSKSCLELHQRQAAQAALQKAQALLPGDPRVIYLRERLPSPRE